MLKIDEILNWLNGDKIELYLDCDGVIKDTINTTLTLMTLEGYDIKDKNQIDYYFTNKADWSKIWPNSPNINDSINTIKYLDSLGIFNISILTKCTSKMEPFIKIKGFSEELPGIPVIIVDDSLNKSDVVDATGSFLIDDSTRNVIDWINNGGIGVHFFDESNKKTGISDLSQNNGLLEINNLLNILYLLDYREVSDLIKVNKGRKYTK